MGAGGGWGVGSAGWGTREGAKEGPKRRRIRCAESPAVAELRECDSFDGGSFRALVGRALRRPIVTRFRRSARSVVGRVRPWASMQLPLSGVSALPG